MIVRAAVKVGDELFVARKGKRHDEAILLALEKHELTMDNHVQGFITDAGEFLDRKQAAEHALQCGQIGEHVDTLISEDVW